MENIKNLQEIQIEIKKELGGGELKSFAFLVFKAKHLQTIFWLLVF